MWSDIDHMDRYHDFTFDPQRYPVADMRAFVDRWGPRVQAHGRRPQMAALPPWRCTLGAGGVQVVRCPPPLLPPPASRCRLHAEGQRWVPIVDCGIAASPGDPAYEEGLAAGLFLRDVEGNPYLGEVRCRAAATLCPCTLCSLLPPPCVFASQQPVLQPRQPRAALPSTLQVWPGPVHFPDFLHPASGAWWARQLQRMHDQVPFDG